LSCISGGEPGEAKGNDEIGRGVDGGGGGVTPEGVVVQESIAHYRIDGSTSGDERQKLIERFNAADNDDVHVFLISTKAGVYTSIYILICIGIYIHIYTYMYTYTYVSIYTCILPVIQRFNAADNDDVYVFLISTKAGEYIYIYMYIYVHIYAYTYIYIFRNIYICIYIYIHTYMYKLFIYIYMYMYSNILFCIYST